MLAQEFLCPRNPTLHVRSLRQVAKYLADVLRRGIGQLAARFDPGTAEAVLYRDSDSRDDAQSAHCGPHLGVDRGAEPQKCHNQAKWEPAKGIERSTGQLSFFRSITSQPKPLAQTGQTETKRLWSGRDLDVSNQGRPIDGKNMRAKDVQGQSDFPSRLSACKKCLSGKETNEALKGDAGEYERKGTSRRAASDYRQIIENANKEYTRT